MNADEAYAKYVECTERTAKARAVWMESGDRYQKLCADRAAYWAKYVRTDRNERQQNRSTNDEI